VQAEDPALTRPSRTRAAAVLVALASICNGLISKELLDFIFQIYSLWVYLRNMQSYAILVPQP